MLVSARCIGVPRKAERSDVLWGERLADLFKTVTCFYGRSMDNPFITVRYIAFRRCVVAQ